MKSEDDRVILKTEALEKAFGRMLAVDEVSLSVQEGVITSVIGPNGAGKTTLFNLITGHLKADDGEILFKGENIVNLSPHRISRKGIARSFQIVNIFPTLSVFENVQAAIISRLRLNSKFVTPVKKLVREEVHDIINRVDLSEEAESVAGTLSYGDQRIMEVAIALGSKPELLLLDEPTAGMSPEETHATTQLVKKLVEDSELSILFVEHDMDVVFSVSDKIIVMHEGHVIAEGAPEAVRNNEAVRSVYLGEEME